MALPASGPISFNNINVELGVSGTTQASLGQASYRALAGVASGQISMSNFYGKSNQFAFTISSNQTNANLRSLAVAAGWNQTSAVVATISSGVYLSANSTGTPGLTINGSFPGGVSLTNNGFIIGMGGAGGSGGGPNFNPPYSNAGIAGSAGGTALSVSVGVTITNNGTVGGGGGGGGGGGMGSYTDSKSGTLYYSGSGGGGGRTGTTNSAGGAGATGGNVGGVGTSSSAGSGGTGINGGGRGGNGGNWGTAGSSGNSGTGPAGGYGAGGGGASGAAVSGNSNVTWAVTGTRLGAIS